MTWVQGNVFELSVAIGMAIIVFIALSWLKRIASKIARESEHRAHVKSIVARTLARTSKFFRVMVSIELVNQIANAPAALTQTVDILFTIAAALQGGFLKFFDDFGYDRLGLSCLLASGRGTDRLNASLQLL